jgi:hypothetical protein
MELHYLNRTIFGAGPSHAGAVGGQLFPHVLGVKPGTVEELPRVARMGTTTAGIAASNPTVSTAVLK